MTQQDYERWFQLVDYYGIEKAVNRYDVPREFAEAFNAFRSDTAEVKERLERPDEWHDLPATRAYVKKLLERRQG